MVKLNLRTEDMCAISHIQQLSSLAIKSKSFYSGFDTWLTAKFIPGLGIDREIISCRDKKYDTLIGFTLLKVGSENKICNLSPMVDGVGITQALLDTCHFYFDKDYIIDVPLLNETSRLHSKLQELGFEIIESNVSVDNTSQLTYAKIKNLGWI
jgi:hypothetical protein